MEAPSAKSGIPSGDPQSTATGKGLGVKGKRAHTAPEAWMGPRGPDLVPLLWSMETLRLYFNHTTPASPFGPGPAPDPQGCDSLFLRL